MPSTSATAWRSRRSLAALARKSPGDRSVHESRAWFDDLASLYAFERDARRELGALRRRDATRPRRLVYELALNVPTYDEQRAVRIEFPASAAVVPRVFVDGPDTRHTAEGDEQTIEQIKNPHQSGPGSRRRARPNGGEILDSVGERRPALPSPADDCRDVMH
jgi:hypothetical protein